MRKRVRSHFSSIDSIKISPNDRFLASADSEGNIVVYRWNSCDIYIFFKSMYPTKHYFDWHPWNGVCLALCKYVNTKSFLFNVCCSNLKNFVLKNKYTFPIGSKIPFLQFNST